MKAGVRAPRAGVIAVGRSATRGRARYAYLALLLVVAAQRGAELLRSRRNERRSGEAIGTAGTRSYPLMVALHMALFWLPRKKY